MSKMFRVIGAFILVLSCGVAPYASAVPGDGGRDLRAQSGETKKRRAKAKEDAGIFTTGRVVCGMSRCTAGLRMFEIYL